MAIRWAKAGSSAYTRAGGKLCLDAELRRLLGPVLCLAPSAIVLAVARMHVYPEGSDVDLGELLICRALSPCGLGLCCSTNMHFGLMAQHEPPLPDAHTA
jgi:hypothetical protein